MDYYNFTYLADSPELTGEQLSTIFLGVILILAVACCILAKRIFTIEHQTKLINARIAQKASQS